MNKVILTILLAVFIFGCGSDDGDDPNNKPAEVGSISGIITNSTNGTAVPNAVITISFGITYPTTSTATDGSYTFNNISAGSVTIIVAKAGYISQTTTAIISENMVTTHSIELLPSSITQVNYTTFLGNTAWSKCYYVSGIDHDIHDTFTFVNNTSVSITSNEFPSTNCAGTLIATETTIGTYALGDAVLAKFGSTYVQALEIIFTLTSNSMGPITPSSVTKLIVYVNPGDLGEIYFNRSNHSVNGIPVLDADGYVP